MNTLVKIIFSVARVIAWPFQFDYDALSEEWWRLNMMHGGE